MDEARSFAPRRSGRRLPRLVAAGGVVASRRDLPEYTPKLFHLTDTESPATRARASPQKGPFVQQKRLVGNNEMMILEAVNLSPARSHQLALASRSRLGSPLHQATNLFCAPTRVSKNISFPNAYYTPSCSSKRVCLTLVPQDVVSNLGYPVPRVRAAHQLDSSSSPPSSMPEVAITEDSYAAIRKNDVRPTRQFRHIDTIPEPKPL